jgi:hypothetical protein
MGKGCSCCSKRDECLDVAPKAKKKPAAKKPAKKKK